MNRHTIRLIFPDGAPVDLSVPSFTLDSEAITVTTRSEPFGEDSPITHEVGRHIIITAQANDAIVRLLWLTIQDHARQAFAEWMRDGWQPPA